MIWAEDEACDQERNRPPIRRHEPAEGPTICQGRSVQAGKESVLAWNGEPMALDGADGVAGGAQKVEPDGHSDEGGKRGR